MHRANPLGRFSDNSGHRSFGGGSAAGAEEIFAEAGKDMPNLDFKKIVAHPNLHTPDEATPVILGDSPNDKPFDYQANLGTLKNIVDKLSDVVKRAFKNSGGLLEGACSTTLAWSRALVSSPRAFIWTCGLGAMVSAIYCVKNVVQGLKGVFHKQEPVVPWVVNFFQALLTGGLTAGLISPAMGWKNPFVTVGEDGEPELSVRTMWGAAAAPLLVGTFNKLAEGTMPIISKLPVIGPMINDITRSIYDFINSLFRTSDLPPDGGFGGGAATPGYGGAGFQGPAVAGP